MAESFQHAISIKATLQTREKALGKLIWNFKIRMALVYFVSADFNGNILYFCPKDSDSIKQNNSILIDNFVASSIHTQLVSI